MHGWDLFCQVIDNFGDIGVAWRLARQLQHEHGCQVRLFVDDLNTFAAICPQLDAAAARQHVLGVDVLRWEEQAGCRPGAVVVELFGCHLELAYQSQLGPGQRWFNLEYLSAEDWIEGCHLLPSPQPAGAIKRFFYPGFTPRSGGLLRERDLLRRRDAWLADPAAQLQWRQQLGLPAREDTTLELLLFCYPGPQLTPWLDALAAAAQPTRLLLCPGAARDQVASWAGSPLLAGSSLRRGALTLCALPMVEQPLFDHLLWLADFCIVRGEDSFVRAQWAARPLLWHIYPQSDAAHLHKLDAFLRGYLHGLDADSAAALQALWLSWNRGLDCAADWQAVRSRLPLLRAHALAWSDALSRQPDLASQLLQAATAERLQ